MDKCFRTPALAILFAESGPTNKVQLFRVGTFHHPEYGKFEITPTLLQEMKKNFDSKVRGIDIAIDYKHDSDDVAAGWVTGLELGDQGKELWANVDWTPNGAKVLGDKEFRYLSPDFTMNYQDNESLKKFGAVLLGAGLTNRPVIKKMEPAVELMEYKYADHPECVKKWIPELIANGHDQEQAVAIAYSKCKTEGEKQMSEDKAKLEGMAKELADLKVEVATLKAEKVKAELKLAEVEQAKKLAEKKSSFAKLMAEGKACAAQEDAYLSEDFAKFAELAKPVKLSESGHGGQPPAKKDENSDPVNQIIKFAEEIRKNEPKVSMGDAISRARAEHPDLVAKAKEMGE